MPPDLSSARMVLAAGDKAAARQLLTAIVRAGQADGETWHLLGQTLDDPIQKADCERRAKAAGYVEAVVPPPVTAASAPPPAPTPVVAPPAVVAPMPVSAAPAVNIARVREQIDELTARELRPLGDRLAQAQAKLAQGGPPAKQNRNRADYEQAYQAYIACFNQIVALGQTIGMPQAQPPTAYIPPGQTAPPPSSSDPRVRIQAARDAVAVAEAEYRHASSQIWIGLIFFVVGFVALFIFVWCGIPMILFGLLGSLGFAVQSSNKKSALRQAERALADIELDLRYGP